MLLLWLACAFVAGDVLGALGPAWGAAWLALALLVAIAAVPGRARRVRTALLALSLFGLGAAVSPHPGPPRPGTAAALLDRNVDVVGVIAAEPDVRGRTVIYSVDLTGRRQGELVHPLSGRIEARASAAVDFAYGDQVELRGILRTITGPAGGALRRQGVMAEMVYPRTADLGPVSTGWRGVLVRLRQRIEAGIDRWLPEPEAALLIAITLGARSASLGDLAQPLVVTGLIHLVAISGIKVSLFSGMVHQLVRRAGSRYLSSALPLGLLWTYVALTGFTNSGMRSAIMWTLVFLAAALGRRTVTLVSLGLAVAVMVALRPDLPWDTGFQMSALGTFFIVAYAEPVDRLTRFVPPPFREALAVTIAAQLGTLPVVIAGFKVVSLSGPITNALVLPLVPALIVLGFVLGLVAGVPIVAAPLAGTAAVLCRAVVWVGEFGAAHTPPLTASTLPAVVTAAYYTALALMAVRILHRLKWVPPGRWSGMTTQFALSGLIAVGGLAALMGRQTAANGMTPLGPGEGVLIQSGGRSVLLDGSPQPFVLLERLANRLPFGQRSIDLIISTDPRSSNTLGLLTVARRYRVGAVLDTGVEYPSATYAQWRAQLRRDRVPVYALRTGVTVAVGGARFMALGPDAVCALPVDCVGLVRVRLRGVTYLFAGAASLREQREAVFRPVDLRAGVLVTAARTLDPDFLRAVGPRRMVRLPVASRTGPGG